MRFVLLLTLLTSMITFDPLPKLPMQDDAKKAERAQELLKQTRAALGSDKIKSLSIVGTQRQKVGENETSGDLELDLLLPDKFLKSTVINPIANIEITRLEALNGEAAWTDMKNNAPTSGGFVFRTAGGPTASPEQQKAQQSFVRQEWTRLLLGILGQPLTSVQLDCSYAGEAEAPDGLADMIEVKSKAIGFSAQLFLDQKTHRPLMLTYQGRKTPQMRMTTRQISHDEAEKKKTPEEMEKEVKEMQAKAQAAAAAEPLVEIQLRFEDYQSEGGVTLPHRITRTVDGQMTEEWQLTKFKINPTIKADKFEKK